MIDTEVMTTIQDALQEPADGGATFPSGLWTQTEVLHRMNERQNRFLKATQAQVGVVWLDVAAGVRRVQLPPDWLTTLDVRWRPTGGAWTLLLRSDSFETDHALPGWSTNTGTPEVYMDEDAPLLQVQIAPAPPVAGQLEVLYIPQGEEMTGTGDVLLQVPDEMAAGAVKYGALADLLNKDGRGKSPERAAYCELRYRLAEQVVGLLLAGRA